MSLNQSVFELIFSFSGKSPVFDAFGIFVAEYLSLFLVAGIFFFISSYQTWRERGVVVAFFLCSLILSRGILVYMLAFFFPMTRPFAVLNFTPLVGSAATGSFPSVYAAIFFSLAFCLFFLRRSWGLIYIIAVCGIGWGRIFVGLNWPIDVVGGFLVALAGTGLVYLLLGSCLDQLIFKKR